MYLTPWTSRPRRPIFMRIFSAEGKPDFFSKLRLAENCLNAAIDINYLV
jgi:hypothetical protein